MEEIWKDIVHYEGLYQVSNLGRVKSVERDKFLPNGTKNGHIAERIMPQFSNYNPKSGHGGYMWVSLWKFGKVKQEYVHRLVALAFIPNPENKPQVNHKDEVKTNNAVDNLEWCDCRYNNMYGTKRARYSKTRRENAKGFVGVVKCDLDGNELEAYTSMREAERANNLANSTLYHYFKENWQTCGGFKWKKNIMEELK